MLRDGMTMKIVGNSHVVRGAPYCPVTPVNSVGCWPLAVQMEKRRMLSGLR